MKLADDDKTSFAIASRLLISGEVAVVLHLYRGGKLALKTMLATCDREEARSVLRHSRYHLTKLGIPEEHSRAGLN